MAGRRGSNEEDKKRRKKLQGERWRERNGEKMELDKQEVSEFVYLTELAMNWQCWE